MCRLTTALFFSVVLACAWTGVGSAGQKTREDAKSLKNPVASTPESVEAGRKSYVRYCLGCHGPEGKGDGSMALSGGTPSNLVDETWDYGSSDGEIFVVIKEGVSADMEAYKDRLTEKQIWEVINYMRSLAKKERSQKSEARIQKAEYGNAPMALIISLSRPQI
ncbi:MAG TPA: cytochrome c [Blastocatellia bacterium]|nr:cytochrome c [Blastocatellia bacterium]